MLTRQQIVWNGAIKHALGLLEQGDVEAGLDEISRETDRRVKDALIGGRL